MRKLSSAKSLCGQLGCACDTLNCKLFSVHVDSGHTFEEVIEMCQCHLTPITRVANSQARQQVRNKTSQLVAQACTQLKWTLNRLDLTADWPKEFDEVARLIEVKRKHFMAKNGAEASSAKRKVRDVIDNGGEADEPPPKVSRSEPRTYSNVANKSKAIVHTSSGTVITREAIEKAYAKTIAKHAPYVPAHQPPVSLDKIIKTLAPAIGGRKPVVEDRLDTTRNTLAGQQCIHHPLLLPTILDKTESYLLPSPTIEFEERPNEPDRKLMCYQNRI